MKMTRYKEIFIGFLIIFLISLFALRSIFSDYYYFISEDYTTTIGEVWNLYLNLQNGSFSIWLDKFMYPSYPVYKITLAILTYILNGNILLATKLYIFIIFFLSGISMYISSLIVIRNRLGALIASLGYIFSYFILGELAFSHWNIEFITLPLIFGIFFLFINSKYEKRYFFIMILGISASALYYETGFQLMLFLFISSILYSIFNKDTRPFIYTIFAIFLALIITGPITLPIVDKSLSDNTRFLSYDEQISMVKRFSIPFDIIFPDIQRYFNVHINNPEMHGMWGIISDTPYPPYYLGYSLMFLAFVYIIFSYSKLETRDKETSFILFLNFILFLFISQGIHLRWLYDFLYNYLPFFKSTRVPIRFLLISVFTLSILSGFGASTINKFIKDRLKIFPILLLAIIIIDLVPSTGYLDSFGVGKDNLLYEYNGLKIYEIKWINRDPIMIENNRPFKYIGTNNNFIIVTDNIQSIKDIISIYKSMENKKDFIAYPTDYYRVAHLDSGVSLHNKRIISLSRFGPFVPEGYVQFYQNITKAFKMNNVKDIIAKMSLIDARYIIIHNWPTLDKVGLYQNRLIENLNHSSYFREIVKGKYDYLFEFNNSFGNIWAGYIDKDFNPHLDSSVEISDTRYNTGYIKFNVSSQKPSFVVINEPYYKGWKAYIGEKETKILNNKFFMQLPIKTGYSEVKLIYDKYSYIPYLISYIAFILLYFSIIFLVFRKISILIIAIPIILIGIFSYNFISETIIALSQWVSIILCIYITGKEIKTV